MSNPPIPEARQGNATSAQQQIVPQRYGGPAAGGPTEITGVPGAGQEVRQSGSSAGDLGDVPPLPPIPSGRIR